MKQSFLKQTKIFFYGMSTTVKEINKRYKKPRIKMTKSTSLALLMLRLYLFALIALMLFKFITLVYGH